MRKIACPVLVAAIFCSSCRLNPEVELLRVKTIPDFPSASALEFYENQVYVWGDDAPHLLVLGKDYQPLDTIRFLKDTAYRISKDTKADIESAALSLNDGSPEIYALGSFSTKQRGLLFSFPLRNPRHFGRQDVYPILNQLSRKELNIEGLAVTGGQLVLANRANAGQPENELILYPFWDAPSSLHFIRLKFVTPELLGISGLCYIEKRDLLLFTASTEETPNALEDGKIGDSYLGWIENFSSRQKQRSIQPDVLINLSDKDQRFRGQKIESVCLEEVDGKQLILHLAADNDNGQSSLFKIRLSL